MIELNRSRNNVVLSRRAVLEDERKEMRQAILDRLSPGDVVEGQISNIVDFGAFVDLDGMDGLIHISELSWSHVNHPSEVLEIGQTVEVKVLDIDRERQRISLGLKQTQSDPWQQVLDSYGEGDVVEGRVTKVVTFGAFVEILPGVEGLVHISELAQHHVENPREVVSQGDLVNVQDHRGRRRAPPPLALAEARRGRRRDAAAAGRRGADRAADRPLRGGLRRDAPAERAPSSRRRPRPRPSSRGGARAETDAAEPSRRGAEAEAVDEAEAAGRRAGAPRPPSAAASRSRARRSGRSRAEPRARSPSPSPAASARARPRRSRVRAPRRGDAVERRDRPPADRRGPGGARRARASGSATAPTGPRSPRSSSPTRTQLAWLEALLHPRVAAAYRDWRRGSPRSTPGSRVTEMPLLYEGRRGRASTRSWSSRRPTELRAARNACAGDERARAAAPRRGEGAPGRLRLRERRHARRPRRVRRPSARRAAA